MATIDWSKSNLIPRNNLLAWHALPPSSLASGNAVQSVADWSGSGRHLIGTTPYPVVSNDILNGHDGIYFNGAANPLKYAGTILVKQILIVASVSTATFAGNEGLLSDLTTFALLVGAGAGSVKFFNNGYASLGYTYRKNSFVTGEANQLAPVGAGFAVMELRIPQSLGLDGIQIGQDRTLAARKFNGVFMESLFYAQINDDCANYDVYQYFARKYHLWQENGAGKYIFPFRADHNRNETQGRVIFSSKAYSGKKTNLLRGGRSREVNLNFGGDRRQSEFLAAEKFHEQHFGLKECVFRDYKFDPPRDSVMEIASPITDAGGGFFFDYSFSAALGEIDSYSFLTSDADDYLVTG